MLGKFQLADFDGINMKKTNCFNSKFSCFAKYGLQNTDLPLNVHADNCL